MTGLIELEFKKTFCIEKSDNKKAITSNAKATLIAKELR
jgi:hypothetical protein